MERRRTVTLSLARPLVLVGMMGAGKTSVGRRLAQLLDAPFRDSDLEIEAAAGMSVADLFARFGEPAFRDGERRVVGRLLAEPVPVVLATGGGAFIEPATREVIRARATTVWLRAEVETLWRRVRGKKGRPLLEQADPRAALAAIDARRRPIYAEADVMVDSRPGLSHEAMARSVLAAVEEFDKRTAAAGTPITLKESAQ